MPSPLGPSIRTAALRRRLTAVAAGYVSDFWPWTPYEPRASDGECSCDADTRRERVAEWVLVAGDRRTVAGCLVVAIAGVVWTLVSAGVLAVGPTSSVSRTFGNGFTSGVITLLTIALSINQLVLSRVFGPVSGLMDRLDGSRELRRSVESIAGVPSSPNDPANFLSLVATTLTDRARGLAARAATRTGTHRRRSRARCAISPPTGRVSTRVSNRTRG